MSSEHHRHEHDCGLGHDLRVLMGRRRLLGMFAGASLVTLAGCATGTSGGEPPSGGAPRGGGTPSAGPPNAAASGSANEIPQETAGPFPGDGSNGPNVLTESGIVRSDIRSSFGGLSGTATGVPLTIELTVTDSGNGGVAFPGAAVYVWHCDRDASYSLYDIEDQNYLRGVQVADTAGKVRFTSIFPAAYSGRWPHIHFEVYPNLAATTSSDSAITTSQLALPEATCTEVYTTDGYRASVRNMARTPLDSDSVFRDGYSTQLATVTGSVSDGLAAALTVPVEV
ncbi:MAG: intradiol ring-cleavage dioxygenase [Pseudonocardiaceae bacterium]